jgi:hypothetical protein
MGTTRGQSVERRGYVYIMASGPSGTLNDETIREIQRRLALGDMQHDIAADLGINQGRVSEVNTGKRRPANDNHMPSIK